ncbi:MULTISPECIES: hypothetical protein [Fischerella]|uniref:Uncharacterized protein n=1 Tax=Fischerella muscicola CCMEE 5323 TaxID=2019572 RepID=A0A2N6K8N7_FISMU|nr:MULTISPECIES: hypothetical protein [Fischerella]MBD2431039.1 hypothetical protein [Fischerella sp. FACHB-380]PLZ94042.1 hypothetical protein CEN44_01600 [Fischerella muscicola CCMEE 5323]
MLKSVETVQTPSVKRLLKLWARRYTLDFYHMSLEKSLYTSLITTASPEGRALTSTKLRNNLLNINCQMACIQTKTFYSYIPNIIDLNEARLITQFAFRVYKKILDVYEKHSVEINVPTNATWENNHIFILGIPEITELAYSLEPVLLVFQEQHVVSKDWRSLGFMTTQLNFTNQLILKKLTPTEKILLTPYLKFVEEQVAMPWQRVCAAAVKYEIDSQELKLMEQMILATPKIAESVYQQLVELLPNHHSRRGELSKPDVKHSCLRDLNMFQAYLWLCFLENSMASIETELLPLCVMVVEGVGIQWEMTEKWCQLLTETIISHLNTEQKTLLCPCLQQMQQLFLQERSRLGYKEELAEGII